MGKYEFLAKLREALSAELPSQVVEGHIRYYDQYITDAVMGGRTEQSVMDELGDPWMIARTIIDTSTEEKTEEFIYDATGQDASGYNRQSSYNNSRMRTYTFHSGWKWILVLLAILVVLGAVISIVSGVITLLAPILLPLVLVMIVVQIFRRRN